jgi:hypothetical protein
LKHIEGEQGPSDGEEVNITIRDVYKDSKVAFIPDSISLPPIYVNSFNVKSSARSINSI